MGTPRGATCAGIKKTVIIGPGAVICKACPPESYGLLLPSFRRTLRKTEVAGFSTSHTFVVTSTNVGYIGQGLELVDAGDYDMDGHSELLFWSSAYNRDGYVLFPSNLAATPTTFQWNYH
jgi:hypothetical protein